MHTFNALLHTCVRTREMGSGLRLLQRMEAAEIPEPEPEPEPEPSPQPSPQRSHQP